MKKILLSLLLATFLLLPKLSFAQVPCNATGTVCGQNAYDTCTPICNGAQAAYDCYQASNQNCRGTILCASENSRCQVYSTPAYSYPTPSYSTPTTRSTCQTDCNKCPTATTCGTKTYDTCRDDKGQFNSSSSFCQNGAQKFRCFAKDNPNCTSSSAGVINEYNYSCSACGPTAPTPPSPQPEVSPSTQPSTQPSTAPSTNPSEKPAPKKPVRIIIEQFDQPVQTLDPSANLNEAKLNLNFDENGIANVRFQVDYDYFGKESQVYYVQYKLKQKPTSSSINEFLVDLMIHKPTLANPDDITNWAKDTINSYINSKFEQAGIIKRLKVGNIYTVDNSSCPLGTVEKKVDLPAGVTAPIKCESNRDNKIRVWLYGRPDSAYGLTYADQETATVNLTLDGNLINIAPNRTNYSATLTHEIAHMFTLPDYYNENVPSGDNNVVPISITSYVNDFMGQEFDPANRYFSETSKGFVNNVVSLPAGAKDSQGMVWADRYTPKKIILRVVDFVVSPGHNIPAPNTKVEVFAQEGVGTGQGGIIPKQVSFSGVTDQNGEFELGNYNKLFNRSDDPLKNGVSASLRLTINNQVRYTAITRSYLNTIYFQGQTETATIVLPFYALTVYDPKSTTLFLKQPALPENRNVDTDTSQPTPTATPAPLKLIDFNNDGVVNIFDRIIFAQKKLGL